MDIEGSASGCHLAQQSDWTGGSVRHPGQQKLGRGCVWEKRLGRGLEIAPDMSRQGVWQLKRLVLSYCETSGSSKGSREFLKHMAPEFQKANEHLAFVTVPVKGRHPQWEAYYVNNSRRAVGLRNADMTEVLRQGMLLRCNTGRKAALQVKNRQRSQTPSIQGMWTPQLQDALSKQGAPSSV